MKKIIKNSGKISIALLVTSVVLLFSIGFLLNGGNSEVLATTWPTSWNLLDVDPNDCTKNQRDVLNAYYALDGSYLYLRMNLEDNPNPQDTLYKWFLDKEKDAYVNGQNIYNYEYVIVVYKQKGKGSQPIRIFQCGSSANKLYTDCNVISDPSVLDYRIDGENLDVSIKLSDFGGTIKSVWWATDDNENNINQQPNPNSDKVDWPDTGAGDIPFFPVPECTTNADCDDGKYCNGIETCDTNTGTCQSGIPVDCSSYNIFGIATCTNDPDCNPFTWDWRAEFTSYCDENTDSCATGNETITHTCSVNDCNAECDAQHPCPDTDCDSKNGCVGNDYYTYTDVANSCQEDCTCTKNKCGAPQISYNDPACTECQTDDDCDTLDRDYCDGTVIKHDEGVCVNYECEVETTEVLDCDDGLACNGQETCSNANCVAGTEVDCSSYNLFEIATCYYDPDCNPFTWDYRVAFISECQEPTGECSQPTEGELEITHTCDKSQCGAECETNTDCDDQIPYTTDICNLDTCQCEHTTLPHCGDRNLDEGEECDDGNNENGDGCSVVCEIETLFYEDADGDGYGNPEELVYATEQPEGYVDNDDDCDDTNADIHPGATEICGNGIDEDCDGEDAVCPSESEPTPRRRGSATHYYNLTVKLEGTGSGTVTSDDGKIDCGSDCSDSYAFATSVVLTATPDELSEFAGWAGACSGTEETCTLLFKEDKTVIANFKAKGEVLGEATCGLYLLEYIKYGAYNNPEEVRKLQKFLNDYMGANLPITGIYDLTTMEWVNKFQLQCKEEVLRPWVQAGVHPSEDIPTGYVYKTTQRWINMIMCPQLNLPMPDLSEDVRRLLRASQSIGEVAGEETTAEEEAEEGLAEGEGEEFVTEGEEEVPAEEAEVETVEPKAEEGRTSNLWWVILLVIAGIAIIVWYFWKGSKK